MQRGSGNGGSGSLLYVSVLLYLGLSSFDASIPACDDSSADGLRTSESGYLCMQWHSERV